ncbi:MAG TPA: FGGY family carbohydrate kinase, partial [Candidatus Limnocylindria bacterium]
MGLVLGIDVSTTATKAILIEPDGAVRGIGSADLRVSMPQPGWSEQDPADWWSAAGSAISQALAAASASGADVEAVGLTGQMHGAVLLDAGGAVLR